MRGLVVGRFQPLHNGHASVIRAALEDCVNVVVGIGSSNVRESVRNPFSTRERREMLEAVFADQIKIVELPDLNNPPVWAKNVLSAVGPVDKVYGNDAETLDWFEYEGVPVVRPGLVERDRLQGQTIRMQLAEGDPTWRRMVPGPVARLVEDWDVGKRLRLLEARTA